MRHLAAAGLSIAVVGIFYSDSVMIAAGVGFTLILGLIKALTSVSAKEGGNL